MDAADALALCSLTPIKPGPKDGLAMVSSNALTLSLAVQVFQECVDLLDHLDISFALCFEALDMNPMYLDPGVLEGRRQKGQETTARRLVSLIQGSSLLRKPNRQLQGSLSSKAGWALHGMARDLLENIRTEMECVINSSEDCPRILKEKKEILSSPNFILTSLVIAFESLGIALAHISRITCNRILRMGNPALSTLPEFLRSDDKYIAFSTLQKTLSALDTEVRHLANPA